MIHQSHHPSNQIAVRFQTTYVVSIHDKNSAQIGKSSTPIILTTIFHVNGTFALQLNQCPQYIHNG